MKTKDINDLEVKKLFHIVEDCNLAIKESQQIKNETIEEIKKVLDEPGTYRRWGYQCQIKNHAGRMSFNREAMEADFPDINYAKYHKKGKEYTSFKLSYEGDIEENTVPKYVKGGF